MSLKRQIWCWLFALIGLILVGDMSVSYIKLQGEFRAETEADARVIYGIMMATRRVYQEQFVASGVPLNNKTVGFLPAHSFSRIAKDFAHWNDSGLIFNNVSDQPRNPENQADADELKAMAWYRGNPRATERLDRVRSADGKTYLLYSAPIWVEPSCLKCHGNEEAAPPSIREAYSSAYGYQVGELRGLVSIKVPTEKYDRRFMEVWAQQILKSLIGYGLVLMLIGYLLEKLIIARLAGLKNGAAQIASGNYAFRLPVNSADELCRLAAAFNDMAAQIESRDQRLTKFSQAVEQTPESIIITDVAGRIEYVNARFVENSGYTREEVLGQNPSLLHSGATSAETFRSLWNCLRAGQIWHGEFNNRRKDGSTYIEEAIVAPIRLHDGEVTHYLAIKRDITEQKQVAQELANYRQRLELLVEERTAQLSDAQQRAEAANQAKSDFLANMSHEIRTPLNAITGMAHLIRRSGLTPEQSERMDKLEAASEHLLDTINAVLDLSKIEAGRLVLEAIPFRIEAIVDNVCSMLTPRSQAQGVALLHEVPRGLPAMTGDPTRLQQALLNLAGNALKFTARGHVRIVVEVLAETPADIDLCFKVEDTGDGVPPELQGRLFSPFEQADASTTRKYGGSGLGLAITRHIAEAMGGSVGVKSVVGQGSTFWFSVRLLRSTLAPVETRRRLADAMRRLRSQAAGKRILLVEDEPINREIAQMLLEDAGLPPDLAEDGEQAVAMARARTYDLILMDMQMPKLDGVAACRQIRQLGASVPPKIVAMTANAFAEDRARCLEAGMDDFMSKPIDAELFYDRLSHWLQL